MSYTQNRSVASLMHINPAHKGKFRHNIGKSAKAEVTAGDVEKGLRSKSGLVRKEANFARMAKRHWKPLPK